MVMRTRFRFDDDADTHFMTSVLLRTLTSRRPPQMMDPSLASLIWTSRRMQVD